MRLTALLDKRGLTLVEVMIALVILLLVFLALMQTALVSINANMTNVLRDEAVNIAEQRMNEARNIPFASLTAGVEAATNPVPLGAACAATTPIVADPYPVGVTRNIRNITGGFNYGTQRTVTNLDTDNRQITILVRWVYRNECFGHTISTILRRQ